MTAYQIRRKGLSVKITTRRTARSDRLLVEPMGDEVVVYDQDSDVVHHLNAVTAAVWRLLDGQRDLNDVRIASSPALGVDVPAAAITEAIRLLEEARLLLPEAEGVRAEQGLTRRQMLVRMGLTAAAIPVITTILAPTPAAALTCTSRACKRNGTVAERCPGETTSGSGNCRCSANNGTCGPCVATTGTTTDPYLCCTQNVAVEVVPNTNPRTYICG